MNDNITLTIALGVALSMLWELRTGFSSGGLVAPGVLAVALDAAAAFAGRVALGIAIAFGVWGILLLLSQRFCLYGRMRVGVAMLAALAIRAVAGELSPDPFWFGWVVPGLVAADMQRQGVYSTIASLFICSFAVLFSSELITAAVGVFR